MPGSLSASPPRHPNNGAALDGSPTGGHQSSTKRESNASLDGWLLSYITKKEVEAWADRYYGEEMSIDWREMLKDGVATWDDVWKSYFESHTGGWH